MTRFQPNPRFGDEVRALPGLQRVKREQAKAIVERAQLTAPVLTGHYRRSLRWVSTPEITAAVTTDLAGHIVEFGGASTPALAPLRGAVRSLGLRYVGLAKPT